MLDPTNSHFVTYHMPNRPGYLLIISLIANYSEDSIEPPFNLLIFTFTKYFTIHT